MDEKEVKKTVQAAYGLIVQSGTSCCSSCGCDTTALANALGYSEDELSNLPEGANLGLSCGNPTSLAGLKEGEVVLDLGSGAGFDCFVVSPKVGSSGKVIGVDMTPGMVEKARENAKKGNFTNVEFRLGEIENLPLEDNSVDVVISNCVINLSPNKNRVFQEIHRVLKPGGRIAISDMALLKELPERIRQSMEAYTGCIAGAILVEEYRRLVEASGISGIKVTVSGASSCFAPDTTDPIARDMLDHLDKGESLQDYAVSVYVEGAK
jgi:arsenite methyltransferase